MRNPKTCPVEVTVGELRQLFADDHVHMALLTRDGYLHGCVIRSDLSTAAALAPALSVARLCGRTVAATQPIEIAWEILQRTGARRLAVVDDSTRLIGLLCLKQSGTGFCSDTDVAARATEKQQLSMGLNRPGARTPQSQRS